MDRNGLDCNAYVLHQSTLKNHSVYYHIVLIPSAPIYIPIPRHQGEEPYGSTVRWLRMREPKLFKTRYLHPRFALTLQALSEFNIPTPFS